ncbi:MAG: hypothetical protein LUC31_00140 [Coprobacillus sp.]|nr:hypothetical protein [Coprobacillus sp.]
MQAGVNKRGVRSFFTYFTVPFIIAIVLIYVAWYYIFQWINNVHDWEKITIFAECEGVKESIGHDLLKYMNEEWITEDER